jgi:hypothetical protein
LVHGQESPIVGHNVNGQAGSIRYRIRRSGGVPGTSSVMLLFTAGGFENHKQK